MPSLFNPSRYGHSRQIQGISQRPDAFFRLSPADSDQPQCFAVKRGEIRGRIDAYANHPQFRILLLKIYQANIPIKRLGDVADKIFSGITPLAKGDAYVNPPEGIRFIRSGEIMSEGTIQPTSEVHINLDTHNGLMKRSQLKKGDLLIAIVGATIGAAGVYNETLPANINQAISAVRLNKKVLLPEFVCSYLHSKTGQKLLDYLKRPVARANINLEEIAELPILVPPLHIQQKLIADMQIARDSRRQKLKQADELLSGIDAYLIETLGLIPPTAETRKVFAVRLGQVKGKRIDALAYQPLYAVGHAPTIPLNALSELAFIDAHVIDKPNNEDYPVPYIGLPECSQTEIQEVVMRPYSEVKGRSVVKSGDILFARIEPSIFNKKYVFAEDLKDHEYAYTSTEFYVVTPDHNVVDPYYIYAMFFCAFVFNQVQGKTTGSSGRRRLPPDSFRDLQIPVPPLKTQRIIAAEIRQRREEARRLRLEAEAEWIAAKERFEKSLLKDH